MDSAQAKIPPYVLQVVLKSGASMSFCHAEPRLESDAIIASIKTQDRAVWTKIGGTEVKTESIDALHVLPYIPRTDTDEKIRQETLRYWKKQNKIIRRGDEWQGEDE